MRLIRQGDEQITPIEEIHLVFNLEVLLASIAEMDLQQAKMPVHRQVGPGLGIA